MVTIWELSSLSQYSNGYRSVKVEYGIIWNKSSHGKYLANKVIFKKLLMINPAKFSVGVVPS